MMDRIAKGLQDVKKSVRVADELPCGRNKVVGITNADNYGVFYRRSSAFIGAPLDSPWKDYEMRKGFTREPKRDEPATPVKNYITPSGLQRLKEEHRFLLTRERPAVVEVVAWAASNGDRSENADYQYGKRRLGQIDSRIRFLTKRIDAAVVVDPAAPRPGSAAARVFFR